MIETAKANEYMSSNIVRVGTPLSTLQLGEWVNKVISILILSSPTLFVPPNGALEDIQCAVKQLKQAYILGVNITRHSFDSSQLNIQQLVVNVLDMQKNVIFSQKRQRQRCESTKPITSLTHQLPLTEKDLNVDKILTFTPVSKKGCKRYVTPKGKRTFVLIYKIYLIGLGVYRSL